ncbi:MAG: exonuclease V subunit beta [Chlorobi bacterium OLB7]|nr:MAG: exonuclease V subunit beta [Chlorobi bacterium OLB7]
MARNCPAIDPFSIAHSSYFCPMAEITFTLDQQKAHDALRHLSITANAGSGKTRVLVSRYCDIVEYLGIRPAEMAAITFTEKAASELRTRIARSLKNGWGMNPTKPTGRS